VATCVDRLRITELADDELVARSRDGDGRALDTLLARHRRLVLTKARRYFLVGADFDDVEQEGLIGLYKAVRDFRPALGVSFRAFAELCVTRQIITAIKTARRHKHRPLNQYVSLSAQRLAGDGLEHALDRSLQDHCRSDPADDVVSCEAMSAMRCTLVRMLSTLEVEVLVLYLEGRSYREIGTELGRHVKSIDNALQRIKTKLEDHSEPRASSNSRSLDPEVTRSQSPCDSRKSRT
jgi:RNA polymerase sporulation-specific sigma factor